MDGITHAPNALALLANAGLDELQREDPELRRLLGRELQRQQETLMLVAASSSASPSVLVCEGMSVGNVTTEGYPGARYHAGCGEVDSIEELAMARAREAFGARYANVQPHSGSSANQAVLFALLRPGDTLLGMDLDAGGHLTHGSTASISGNYFQAAGYGVDADGRLDYDAIAELAHRHRPKLIVCGASAYPRQIDFARFRAIADDVGAWLLADVSHISGLIAAGLHPSPIDHAHVTTTSTYKQLCGPRGGLILLGRDFDAEVPADAPATGGRVSPLHKVMQRAVFPYFQGTPNLAAVSAKARALAQVATPEFRAFAQRVLDGAHALCEQLQAAGHVAVSGGTDNHMVLLDLRRGPRAGAGPELTGAVVERALESCGIIVNRNRIPGDPTPARVTSGVRLGTNTPAFRGMGAREMVRCAELVDEVMRRVEVAPGRRGARGEFQLDAGVAETVRCGVRELCAAFPLPGYPACSAASVS